MHLDAATLQLLALALHYCAKAYDYDSGDDGMRVSGLGGWLRVVANRKTSALALVSLCQDYLIVAFQGSKERRDWLINLTAFPKAYAGVRAHWGFASGHDSIWPQIHAIVRANPGKRVLVTGHSQGGAYAELSCLFLHDHPSDVHMLTFGKPNVFLRSAMDPDSPSFPYLKTQLSVVSGSDLVTRLPRFLFGPEPHQTMLYLANNGQDHMLRRGDRVGDFSAKEYIVRDWRHSDSVSDHLLNMTYQQRIERLLARRSHPITPGECRHDQS